MNRCKTAALAGLFLMAAGTASASEYADFLRDLASPYNHCRQSLVLTSSKDNADKANDFHEAMDMVLDQAAAAKSPEELIGVAERYGAWLKIKWEEQALAGDLAPLRKEFEPAYAEGRQAVADYPDALRAGNAEAAKKLSGGVKGAYKKVWSLDPG